MGGDGGSQEWDFISKDQHSGNHRDAKDKKDCAQANPQSGLLFLRSSRALHRLTDLGGCLRWAITVPGRVWMGRLAAATVLGDATTVASA